MAARQGRRDIPFTIFKNFVFPAAQNLHTVFLFKAKNSDLGYVPPPPRLPPRLPTGRSAQAGQAQAPVAAPLQAKVMVFLQFLQMENGAPTKTVREIYIPALLQADSATYNPDAEEWYSTGYPLPAGNYLLAMALASPDLKKVGVGYFEFSLPDAAAMQNTLETTPLFFVKKIDQMQAPETRTAVHKGCFMYSVLQIVPNVESVIAPGESIEILYYIFGAKPNDQQKNDIEVTYEVKQADKAAIKWAVQTYDFALVSQPLPLKQTVLIKNDQGEKQETRDLPAGKYTLVIRIKDKIGGSTSRKDPRLRSQVTTPFLFHLDFEDLADLSRGPLPSFDDDVDEVRAAGESTGERENDLFHGDELIVRRLKRPGLLDLLLAPAFLRINENDEVQVDPGHALIVDDVQRIDGKGDDDLLLRGVIPETEVDERLLEGGAVPGVLPELQGVKGLEEVPIIPPELERARAGLVDELDAELIIIVHPPDDGPPARGIAMGERLIDLVGPAHRRCRSGRGPSSMPGPPSRKCLLAYSTRLSNSVLNSFSSVPGSGSRLSQKSLMNSFLESASGR